MQSKVTVVSWDGKSITFERALLETKDGEYHIQDLSGNDVHYSFPMANVFYLKEEHAE